VGGKFSLTGEETNLGRVTLMKHFGGGGQGGVWLRLEVHPGAQSCVKCVHLAQGKKKKG